MGTNRSLVVWPLHLQRYSMSAVLHPLLSLLFCTFAHSPAKVHFSPQPPQHNYCTYSQITAHTSLLHLLQWPVTQRQHYRPPCSTASSEWAATGGGGGGEACSAVWVGNRTEELGKHASARGIGEQWERGVHSACETPVWALRWTGPNHWTALHAHL